MRLLHEERGRVHAGQRIGVAVSGGADSVALLHLLLEIRERLGIVLFVVHFNHQLRGKASRADETFVTRLAEEYGLPFFVGREDIGARSKREKANLEDTARRARYNYFNTLSAEEHLDRIAVAHTAEDQAETVLIRLARGSGLTGLSGMRRSRPVTDAGLMLVRPLLGIPKSRLIATLRAENIAFAEDPSNRDPRFTRARLRGLMPKLEEEGLDAPRLALLAGRLARAEEAIRETADAAYDTFGKPIDRRIEFDAADALNLIPDEIALRLLGRAIGEFGDEGPVELRKLEALHSALVNALQTRARVRRSLAGAVVTLNGRSLTVERAPPRRSRTLTTDQSAPRRQPKKR